jgi:hypothetical protein
MLVYVTAIGTLAQVAMVIAGHSLPVVKNHVFAIGGMIISLLAGLLFVRLARGGWGSSLIGGGIAGGVCALLGILVSAALGDVPLIVVAFGTSASVVAGIAGGALGRVIVKAPA